jgi:hypothetical protein
LITRFPVEAVQVTCLLTAEDAVIARRYRFFDELRRAGTLAPFSRASLKPIAIACLRLLTLLPELLLRLPFFRRRIADATRFEAARPYFAITHLAHSEVHGVFQKMNEVRTVD